MQYNVQCNVQWNVQYNGMCNAMQCNAMQCNAMQCNNNLYLDLEFNECSTVNAENLN